ncbi:MAG: hypothetical protein ACYC3B_09570 [Sedimentisphaerales bacterium]
MNKEIEKLRKLSLDSLRKFQIEILQSVIQADTYIENSENSQNPFSYLKYTWKEHIGLMIGWSKDYVMALPCEVMVRTGASIWVVYSLLGDIEATHKT